VMSCLLIMSRNGQHEKGILSMRVNKRQHRFDITAFTQTDLPGGSTGLGDNLISMTF